MNCTIHTSWSQSNDTKGQSDASPGQQICGSRFVTLFHGGNDLELNFERAVFS